MSLLGRFRRPLAILRGYWPQMAAGFLCLPLHAATVLAWPLLIGKTIDALTGTNPPGGDIELGLLDFCLLLAGLALLEAMLRYASRMTLIRTSRHVEEDLKNQLMTHIGRLPVAWYDRARTGDLVSRLTQDVELMRFLFGPVLLHGGSALWIVPGGLILMATISLPVTAACAGVFALLAISLGLVMPRLRASSRLVQESIGDLSQRAQEAFSGINTVMGLGSQALEVAIMARMNRRYLVHNLRLTRLRATLNAVIHSTASLVVLGVLVVGGLQVMNQQLTIGELFGFWLFMGVMMWPLQALGWTIGMLPRALAAADRIEELFAAEPETREGLDEDLAGRLEVRQLDFTYPGQERPRPPGHQLRPGTGPEAGPGGRRGGGEVHARGPLPATLRPAAGQYLPGRTRPAHPEPKGIAPHLRPGAPGTVPVQRHHRGERELRAGRDPAPRNWRRRCIPRRWIRTWPSSPKAWIRRWGNGGSPCPGARSSGSPWPEPWPRAAGR